YRDGKRRGAGGSVAGAFAGQAAGVHGALGVHGSGQAAFDAERQGGSEGPARAGTGQGNVQKVLRGAAKQSGGTAGPPVGGRFGSQTRGRDRRLFRTRRTLVDCRSALCRARETI